MFNSLTSLTKILPKYFGLNESIEEATSSRDSIRSLVAESTDDADSLADYLVYRYFDEDKQLFFHDNNYCGFMLEISPIVGVDEGLLKNLRYFFNDDLPNNSWLQFLLVASNNVEPILTAWQQSRTNKLAILTQLTKNRVEFVKNLAADFSNNDGRTARDYKIFISFTQRGSNNQKAINELQSFKDKLIKKLTVLNLSSRVCNANDLIMLVRELMQMTIEGNDNRYNSVNSNPLYDSKNLLAHQILQPLQKQEVTAEQIIHHTTGLVSRSYYIKELPHSFSLNRMINLLGISDNNSLAIPARFVISYTVASDLSRGAQAALTSRGTRVIDAAEQWYSRNDRDLKRDAREWQEINDRHKSGEQFLTESFSVSITTQSTMIDTAEQTLQSLYNICDFRLALNTHLQLVSLLAALPMQQGTFWPTLKKFKLTRVCISEEAIARLPIHAEWKGVPKAGVLLHAKKGQLFNFNPFYHLVSNPNGVILSPSGGGKSVFLQELVVSMVSQDVKCFVLDIGQSFANICQLLEGEMIQLGKELSLSLNPFAGFTNSLSASDHEEVIKCTKALLTIMCGIKDDDSHASAALEKALNEAIESSKATQNPEVLDLTNFADYLNQGDNAMLRKFGATLYPYTIKGSYGKYFASGKAASFKKLLTVFEFEEIKGDPKLLAITLQMLLLQVTNQFLLSDRSKRFMIIVDEAWMLLDFAAGFFAAFGRTVRKYGGSLMICVQNYSDLLKTAHHMTILENSAWTIMLKQDEKGLGAFKNSEAFKDMVPLIQSISMVPGKYSEMLIYTTGIRVIGRLVLDNYSKALYSTNAADFNYISRRKQQGVKLQKIIAELADKKYGAQS